MDSMTSLKAKTLTPPFSGHGVEPVPHRGFGHILREARRIIVKVGSSLLVDEKSLKLRNVWLETLCADIARLRRRGQEVLIVSSGAVALGCAVARRKRERLTLEEQQAAAAIGQHALIGAWRDAFAPHGMTAAQILLTSEDTESRRRYLNLRATVDALLRFDAVPVVNENDSLATEELRLGDNDRLAARVAHMASASALVLLSDVDGLYSRDPARHPQARHIPVVHALTEEIENMAGQASPFGSGGMVTKLEAVRIAQASGCHVAIACGRNGDALLSLEHNTRRATWFLAAATPLGAHKRWISVNLRVNGAVVVDQGAACALRSGKSLLPAGVVAVDGDFKRGDTVLIKDEAGGVLGRGLSAWPAGEARRIKGRRSDEFAAILGYAGRSALIHRDDLALDGDKPKRRYAAATGGGS